MNKLGNEETNDLKKKRVQLISTLRAILRPFLLRRLKEDVEKNLPLKKEIILYARMIEDQRKIQEHLLNKSLIPYLHVRLEYGRAINNHPGKSDDSIAQEFQPSRSFAVTV